MALATADLDWERIGDLNGKARQLNCSGGGLLDREDLERRAAERRIEMAALYVRDRYGDYGLTGFYVLDTERRSLEHFVFSCRLMGMGIENWLFERLGRPQLDGDVNRARFDAPADWVTEVTPDAYCDARAHDQTVCDDGASRIVFLKGGCLLVALTPFTRIRRRESSSIRNSGIRTTSLRSHWTTFRNARSSCSGRYATAESVDAFRRRFRFRGLIDPAGTARNLQLIREKLGCRVIAINRPNDRERGEAVRRLLGNSDISLIQTSEFLRIARVFEDGEHLDRLAAYKIARRIQVMLLLGVGAPTLYETLYDFLPSPVISAFRKYVKPVLKRALREEAVAGNRV